ncbi:MAG: hypothetical protein AABZ33_12400 [Chloroflexota bacterium]
MITIECPWCRETVATLTDGADGRFMCPQCAVSEPMMPDPPESLPAAA